MDDSKSLLAKLVAARESWTEAGRFRFKIRRPTEMELIHMRRGERVEIGLEIIKSCVVDWGGVTEADLVSSGASDAAVFDVALYAAWVEDRPELWQPISESLYAAIQAKAIKRETDAKN